MRKLLVGLGNNPVFFCLNVGEKGKRIRELTSVVQKRFKFPENSVELYAEKVNNRGLCAIAQAESLRYKLLGGLAVRRYRYILIYIIQFISFNSNLLVDVKSEGLFIGSFLLVCNFFVVIYKAEWSPCLYCVGRWLYSLIFSTPFTLLRFDTVIQIPSVGEYMFEGIVIFIFSLFVITFIDLLSLTPLLAISHLWSK